MFRQDIMRTVTSISFSAIALTALSMMMMMMMDSQALSVTGSEGSNISVSCFYPETYENNRKYFCRIQDTFSLKECVQTSQKEPRSERGKLALLDDTNAHVLTAKIFNLTLEDMGKYQCGVDIERLPDFTSEIWLTVTTESYSRFMMLVALMCVCALFFVCLFGVLQVLNHRYRSNSGSALHHTRTISNLGPEGHQRTDLPDSSTARKHKEEAANTDVYVDVASAQTQDHIYNKLDSNRQSQVYQSLTADSLQEEEIYYSIDQTNEH